MTTNDESTAMARGFILGAFAGGVIAAGLVLLYAPKKGEELRSDIKQKTNKLLSDAESFVDRTRSHISDVTLDATTKIVEGGTSVKNAVKAGVEAFQKERSRG